MNETEWMKDMFISKIIPEELTPQQVITLLYPSEPSDSELYGDCIMVFVVKVSE